MYLYGICLYLYLYLIGFVKYLCRTSVFMLERGLGKVDRGGLWRAEKNAIEWKYILTQWNNNFIFSGNVFSSDGNIFLPNRNMFLRNGNMFLLNGNMFLTTGNIFLPDGNMFKTDRHKLLLNGNILLLIGNIFSPVGQLRVGSERARARRVLWAEQLNL